MAMSVAMDVAYKEDVGEGFMVITHMNFPADMEHSCQRPVYTL